MKKMLVVLAAMLAVAAHAEVVASIKNAEGGEISFTDIKDDQCPTGHTVISYGMSGRTIFGCWAPGAIEYEIKDGIVEIVVKANVVWANGQKSTYPIKRQRAEINSINRKTIKGAML